MANEIKYSFSLNLTNAGLYDSYNSSTLAATQSVGKIVRNTQYIGTDAAGEELAELDLAGPGFAIFTNLDDTNYVEIGIQAVDFYPFIRLVAGKTCGPVRIGADSVYARADTSPVMLFYIFYAE